MNDQIKYKQHLNTYENLAKQLLEEFTEQGSRRFLSDLTGGQPENMTQDEYRNYASGNQKIQNFIKSELNNYVNGKNVYGRFTDNRIIEATKDENLESTELIKDFRRYVAINNNIPIPKDIEIPSSQVKGKIGPTISPFDRMGNCLN